MEKMREVIKTDSKYKEALNVRTGSLKLMVEGWRRQRNFQEKGESCYQGNPGDLSWA